MPPLEKARPDPVYVQVINAGADKLIRATPYATAWNAGRVLVPEFLPADTPADRDWLEDFVQEHLDFTGSGKETDDQVDAGAAGYDLATSSAGDPFSGYGAAPKRREGV